MHKEIIKDLNGLDPKEESQPLIEEELSRRIELQESF